MIFAQLSVVVRMLCLAVLPLRSQLQRVLMIPVWFVECEDEMFSQDDDDDDDSTTARMMMMPSYGTKVLNPAQALEDGPTPRTVTKAQ